MVYRYFFILLFVTNCFGQITSNSKRIIAKIENEKINFVIDTIKFKKEVSENIFSKNLNIKFNKIKVLHSNQKDCNSSSYYLVLLDQKNNVKTARILNKQGTFLYMSNEDNFKKIYITCVGKKDSCFPSLICKDKKLIWTCSEKLLQCGLDINNSCKKFISVLIEN